MMTARTCSRELVNSIQKLKVELARENSILHFFETTSLAEMRDAVVTVVDLIDNISATR